MGCTPTKGVGYTSATRLAREYRIRYFNINVAHSFASYLVDVAILPVFAIEQRSPRSLPMEIKTIREIRNLFWFGPVWLDLEVGKRAYAGAFLSPALRQRNTEDCLDRRIRVMLYRVMRDNDWSFKVRVEVGVRNRLDIRTVQRRHFHFRMLESMLFRVPHDC
jgi:hypothetical protein